MNFNPFAQPQNQADNINLKTMDFFKEVLAYMKTNDAADPAHMLTRD